MVPRQSWQVHVTVTYSASIVDTKATGRAVYTPTMVNRQMARFAVDISPRLSNGLAAVELRSILCYGIYGFHTSKTS